MEIIANKNFCFLDKAFMQSIDTFFIISLSLNNFYSQLFLFLLLFTLILRFIRKFAHTGLAKLPGFDGTFEYDSSY